MGLGVGGWAMGGGIFRDEILDFCSSLKKSYKIQDTVNIEIPSKTPLLQTPKKSTKSPLLQTSKIRKKSLEKNCAKFFTKNKIFWIFRVFLRKCLKNSSKGTRDNEKKILSSFRDIPEKHVFFDFQVTRPPSTSIHHHPSVNTSRWHGLLWSASAVPRRWTKNWVFGIRGIISTTNFTKEILCKFYRPWPNFNIL